MERNELRGSVAMHVAPPQPSTRRGCQLVSSSRQGRIDPINSFTAKGPLPIPLLMPLRCPPNMEGNGERHPSWPFLAMAYGFGVAHRFAFVD